MNTNAEKLLGGLTSLHNIIAKYDDLCDSTIRSELQTEGFYNSQQIEQHLGFLQQQSRNLKIGIIGRVKAGKSSLINALLFDGKEVLPKAATPMTAALTSIDYKDSFSAEVDFFSPADIAQLKAKAEEYEREVERVFLADKTQLLQRQQEANRPTPAIDDDKLRLLAKRKVGENPVLASAADLYQRIKLSDIDIASLTERRLLQAASAEQLTEQLMDYVGSSGRYMPFTRELKLGMPLESLKGIEVLDTPGINDPVKSREQRTYERLKECNVAFIVSPAGQFISEQDFELADRLSTREGTQEIFIVASQIDNQLHASIKADVNGILPDAIELLRRTMAQQAEKSLAQCNNAVLQQIAAQQNQRLIITSGICETLLAAGGNTNDATAQHAMGLLKKNYPAYFSTREDMAANLALLSGRKALEQAIGSVRLQKNRILSEQADQFITAQWHTFCAVKSNVLAKLTQRRSEVETTDKTLIETKLVALKNAAAKGEVAADTEFNNQLEELRLLLPKNLDKVIQQAIEAVDQKAESAEGTIQQSYRAEKSGFLSWFARACSLGGYEDRTETINTLQPLPVRRVLEGLARLMRNGLQDCATEHMLRWRSTLVSAVTRQLREAIGDDSVDINRLQSVCREIVADMVELPAVDIPELPAALAKTKKLKGSAADDYIEEAQAYASSLEKCGYRFIDNVKTTLQLTAKKPFGSKLLADLLTEMQNLQLMVETKTVTLEKMARMQAELQEI